MRAYVARGLLPREICFGPATLCWPLMPDLISLILPPDLKKASVCSAIDCDVSDAAGCFFFAGAVLGLAAIGNLKRCCGSHTIHDSRQGFSPTRYAKHHGRESRAPESVTRSLAAKSVIAPHPKKSTLASVLFCFRLTDRASLHRVSNSCREAI